ncbi:MAG: hypothetical protein KJO32_15500 [Deltaproteobacteria bacterium]|nr:hypothetical protein [Deltaproteobacteria bacterium]
MQNQNDGHAGKILRVDLTTGKITKETLPSQLIKLYLGGAGIGSYYLQKEVQAGVEWDNPENRIVFSSGPFGGTRIPGAGTFSLSTKGSMVNGAVTTQANGFWGAYLRFAGYDSIIIQGRSPNWVYLKIDKDEVRLVDATSLIGKDTREIETVVREETGEKGISVFGIGPAGENLVRYAVVAGDRGHVASKNGCGCVMGAKRLKAIAISRSRQEIPLVDPEGVSAMARAMNENAKKSALYKYGTAVSVSPFYRDGILPVRNYTTNIFPEHELINGEYIKNNFEPRPKPCWMCAHPHVKMVKVTKGPYAGLEGEQPEYESLSGWGSNVGNDDAGAIIMLSDLTDRLGLDVNESSWTVSWVMECYEKGIFSSEDLDGLEMNWGNVENIRTLLFKISSREGIGNLLADGVKRAAETVGGEALKMAVYVEKGTTPRGHDHRGRWGELLDTCVSATSTLQSSAFLIPKLDEFGLPPVNKSSPWEVAASNAKMDGWFVFLDCLGVCRFTACNPKLVLGALKSITGIDLSLKQAMEIGRRTINVLRVFNYCHGLDSTKEVPSYRYGSIPKNGPAEGKSIMPYFEFMKSLYFELNGWDSDTGIPLPHTLESLGLGEFINDLPAKD